MPLSALILRAEGVIADTTPLECATANAVFTEAGFNWKCDSRSLASEGLPADAPTIIRAFVSERLRASPGSDDRIRLIAAMQRRAGSMRIGLIESGAAVAKAGLRELVTAARREGIALALVSRHTEREALMLARQALGPACEARFAAIACRGETASEPGPRDYASLVRSLDLPAQRCFVIESTAEGFAAARAAGLSAMVLTPGGADAQFEGASFVAAELPEIIASAGKGPSYTLPPGAGQELVQALQRLNEGHFVIDGPQRSRAMKVSEILSTKGSAVKAIRAHDTILTFAQRLKTEGVGAMVVLGPSGSLDGIISERDIAHGLSEHGAKIADLLVADLMTKAVVTCSPEDTIQAVAAIMTQRRFRHLPVRKNGILIGLISIGDVLKHRLDELQFETNVLRDVLIAKS